MITWLMGLLTGQQEESDEPTSRAVVLFMANHSVPQIAAYDRPGVPMIEAQRAVESDIRDYIEQLIETITTLRSELEEVQ